MKMQCMPWMGLALTFTFAVGPCMGLKQPPHIMYMLTDNLGYGNVGYIRNQTESGPSKEVVTPRIDALAHNGIILSRLYA